MAGRRSARISAVGMAGWTVPKLRAELAGRRIGGDHPRITISSNARNAGARDEYGAGSHPKGAVPAAGDHPGPQLHVTRRRRDGEPAD